MLREDNLKICRGPSWDVCTPVVEAFVSADVFSGSSGEGGMFMGQ